MITSGDFSPSQLTASIVKADKMWKDDMMAADFVGNVDTWKAIKKEQNAKLKELEDPEKDREVKVYWVNNCTMAVEDDDGDDCDIEGDEAGSDSKSYGLTEKKRVKFTIDENEFRTNNLSFAEAFAANMLRADKSLSEYIAQVGVSKLESFKGVNEVTDGVGTYNVGTSETDVAATDWNSRLFAYFHRSAIQNHMPNPFLLSGGNMFDENWLAMMNQGNAEGKGAAKLYNSMRKYFDLFNLDTVNSPSYKTYMIQRGSVAFASKTYYKRTMTKYMTQHRWSMPSRNLSGVDFDVYYTNRCSGDTIKHDFMIKSKFDYFLNPTGCIAGRTGVQAYNKV